ncbi:MAG: hypothetical protein PHS54_00240 [Clostridia bacterium]|nr:hypothetical protein [Clostridia bacterium]
MKKSILNRFAQIKRLTKEIENIRINCKHLHVNKTYKGDSGNWDPSDDYYITCFECLDCGKCWHENGHIP